MKKDGKLRAPAVAGVQIAGIARGKMALDQAGGESGALEMVTFPDPKRPGLFNHAPGSTWQPACKVSVPADCLTPSRQRR